VTNEIKEIGVSDTAALTAIGLVPELLVQQRDGHRRLAELLAEHARAGGDKVVLYATGAVLAAGAYLETAVMEITYNVDRSVYKHRKFPKRPFQEKLVLLFRALGVSKRLSPPERKVFSSQYRDRLRDIMHWRIAVHHGQPDHERTRRVGTVLNGRDASSLVDDAVAFVARLEDIASRTP
jgi:hypothetical protein